MAGLRKGESRQNSGRSAPIFLWCQVTDRHCFDADSGTAGGRLSDYAAASPRLRPRRRQLLCEIGVY